jgi:hypothetical protein
MPIDDLGKKVHSANQSYLICISVFFLDMNLPVQHMAKYVGVIADQQINLSINITLSHIMSFQIS